MTAVPHNLICFFDTETSGLPRRMGGANNSLDVWDTCRLVEICWVVCDKATREVIKTRRAIVRPEGFEIPESASKIHGITHDVAAENGEDLETVLREFTEDVKLCDMVVAHNMQFDDNVIRTEMVRCHLSRLAYNKVEKYCTMLRACQIMDRKKWPKLGDLYAEICHKTLEGAHQALHDTMACKDIYFALQDLQK